MNNRTALETYSIGTMTMLSNRLSAQLDAVVPGITYKQWFLLMMTSRMDEGPKSVRAVAEFCGTTRQNAKKMIDQLEADGYLSASMSKTDGRALDVQLTEAGKAFLAKSERAVETATAGLFAQLTDAQLTELSQTLQLLSAGV